MSLVEGEFLGSFRLAEMIGQGSMGVVYRARDSKLGRDVALKVLPRGFAASPEFLERFIREAKLLASLNHPSIASLYDFQKAGGVWFLIMELVEGDTLAERLLRGPMQVDELLPAFIQMAEGLGAAHAKGVIHRDLKPGNVKFTADGRAKLIDFGIARSVQTDPERSAEEVDTDITRVGGVIGTPAYMSPEQACGMKVGPRSDIWSFGCCLFEALAGDRPFRGDSPMGLVAQIVGQEPQWRRLPVSTPEALRDLVIQCLQKQPGDRPEDMVEVRDALRAIEERSNDPIPVADAPRRDARFSALLALDIPNAWEVMQRLGGPEGEVVQEKLEGVVASGLERFHGVSLAGREDRYLMAFDLPSDALLFAFGLQRRLAGRRSLSSFVVRMGIHTGELRAGGNFDLDASQATGTAAVCLELMELASPGQILMTEGAVQSARARLGETPHAAQIIWLDHGAFDFSRLGLSLQLFEGGLAGLSHLKPPVPGPHATLRPTRRPLSLGAIARRAK